MVDFIANDRGGSVIIDDGDTLTVVIEIDTAGFEAAIEQISASIDALPSDTLLTQSIRR